MQGRIFDKKRLGRQRVNTLTAARIRMYKCFFSVSLNHTAHWSAVSFLSTVLLYFLTFKTFLYLMSWLPKTKIY